jgi:DNA-binding transcriptional regulator YhcF (GntR family)
MDFVIHKGTSDPVSAQIARQIEAAIRGAEFLPGERLPSVRALKGRLGVAYNTVLRAYADLMKPGFVYSIPATGVFVAHHAPPPPVPEDGPRMGRERKHWLRLAEALIVQSERCGLEIGDALSEVRLRASLRRRRIERELVERAAKRERRAAAEAVRNG